MTIDAVYAWAKANGMWVLIKSPFGGEGPEAKRVGPYGYAWWVGFTPFGVSGWNGRPDYYGTGPTFADAALVAMRLWDTFQPDLPPADCHSAADIERVLEAR